MLSNLVSISLSHKIDRYPVAQLPLYSGGNLLHNNHGISYDPIIAKYSVAVQQLQCYGADSIALSWPDFYVCYPAHVYK